MNIKTHIEKLNFFLFLLLLISLPFPALFARQAYIVWFLFWLLECRWLHKPALVDYIQRQHTKRLLIPIAGTMALLFLTVLSILWAQDKTETLHSFYRLCSFLPLVCVSLWGVNKYYQPAVIMRTIVLSSVASIGVYLFVYFWLRNPQHTWNAFCQTPINHIDWLSLNNLTLCIKHRLYYTMWLCISIPCLLWLYPDAKQRYGKWEARCLTVLLTAILLIGIYWTGSRQGLINACALFAVMAILHTPTQWGKRHIPYAKYITSFAMVLCVGVGILCLFTFHPRMKQYSIKQWFVVEETRKDSPSIEPRIAIWFTFFEHSKDIPICGVGVGNASHYMTEKYAEKGWERYENRSFSPHNQYLTVWLELGIIIALCFTIFCVATPLCYTGEARHWAIYATIIAMCSMCTENILGKVEGIHFIVITLLIAYLLQSKEPAITARQ